MISLIRGTLIEARAGGVVVDVAGVGFQLGISRATAADLPVLGEEVRLFTRLQVREDAMTLYGFSTSKERAMFDRLVAISGVGAKLALGVLGTYTTRELHAIVMSDDVKAMSKVPGVGKKTAQRLILELRGAFEKDAELATLPDFTRSTLPLSNAEPPAPSAVEDARAALLSMGFTGSEVDLALGGYDGTDASVEVLLTGALRRLGSDT